MELTVRMMGYGIIPKMVMQDPDMTIEAKAIYSYLSSYAGNGNVAFPSVDLICSDLKIGKERFQKHKKLLLEKGYLAIRQEMAGGKFSRNVYVLCETIEVASEEDVPMPTFTATEAQSLGDLTPNSNSLKNILDEDDDSKLNIKRSAAKESFAYWREKWLYHFGNSIPFTRQICEGLEQWTRRFDDPAVVAHAFIRSGRYGGRSYAYLDTILREWWQEGLRTLEDVYDQEIGADGTR